MRTQPRITRITQTITALVAAVGLTTAVVACSEDVAKSDPCAKNPSAKGCKKSSDMTASDASTYAQPMPVAATTPPALPPDAGADAASKAPPPEVPPANVACMDLTRCCGQVKDTLERAGCVAIAVQQKASLCANAIIAYQVFGGCGHASTSLPDIFKSDKTPNTSMDCTYLKRACALDPSQCDAAYQSQCYGLATSPTGSNDPCASAPDPYCCRYPNTFDCGGSPPPADPCASASDPYCCRYPNTFDCGGSPDPCASAPDPECCRYPNSFDCGGTPPTPVDPCASAPDPYCCRNPDLCAPFG